MRFIRFLLEISLQNVLIATVAGLISGGGNALLISLINRSVRQASFPHALLYFAALGLCTLLTSTIAQFMLINLSQNAIYQLRVRLSKSILASPLQHLERLGENRLLATLTDDVRVLAHAVSAIPSICIDLATVVGCLVYLAVISNIIFAVTVGTSALAMWCVQTRLGKAQQLFSLARAEEDNLFKQFQAITRGTKELKLHRSRREDFSSKNLHGSAAKLRQKNSKAMQSFAVANSIGQFLQLSSLAFILFILPWLIHIPLPMLATYVLTTTYLSMPLQNLLRRLPDMLQGNVALQKIDRMKLSLAKQAEVDINAAPAVVRQSDVETTDDSYSSKQPNQLAFQLKLEQVTYLYHPTDEEQEFFLGANGPPPPGPGPQMGRPQSGPGPQPGQWHQPGQKHQLRRPQPGQGPHPQQIPPPDGDEKGFLLGPISLSLQPGQITYIVGGNGSGKSTLAKLITGLYVPETGSIYLDGIPITEHNLEWYRQHFSAIFTDFYLFDSCLGFNHTDIDQEVESYLRHLQLDHKVQVRDGVLSTTNLSQGQRKRLALLTAYLEDRPIYLFDEWASDQEPLFRDFFYKQILVKLKQQGKAVVVITHDDRYFHLADQIIKLDYGKVATENVQLTGYLK